MAVDVTKITGGPAELKLDDVRKSHTSGGISVKFSPKQRMRVVDQYGVTAVDCIHTGDEVRVTAPLAEWTANVLGNIYDPGNDQTGGAGAKYLGIGRSAGYIYSDVDIKVVPLLAADAQKLCQVYRGVQIGELELMHNVEDDRIFKTEWAGLGDPSKTDGELVAKIHITTA
jgi:hypothetical protein